jgi:O-antigen/teichoic acid export membrane protein
MLSAASFAVGLVLVRNTGDDEYGYYVLAVNAIVLAMSAQNAFFNPALTTRIGGLGPAGRGDLVGGLYREQQRLIPWVGGLGGLVALALWYAGALDRHTALLILATIGAVIATAYREYFRMVLFAYRRPHAVLRIDGLYVSVMIAGVFTSLLTSSPALTLVLVLGAAAVASGWLLARLLRRHEAWNTAGVPDILRDIAPLAVWSTAGAAVHWGFSQGYIYLVAGTLDVAAVAALSATRLLIMPVILLSTGVGTLMLVLAAGWLHRLGSGVLWSRICLCAAGLGVAALGYVSVVWLLRDWLFDVILKRHLLHRDEMLALWGAICLAMIVRNQLAYFLIAQGRFRVLTTLTLGSAVVSLAVTYGAILRFGVVGALVGVLVGELGSLAGIIILSRRYTGARFVTA